MNWGKKLMIVMALFMLFIVSLATVMIMRHEEDALIEEDYYEKGQSYDKDYQAKKDAMDDKVIPGILSDDNGIIIKFPVPVKYKLICRRSSDSEMDRIINGFTGKDHSIHILKGSLEKGPWLLRIQYSTDNEKNYLFDDEIMMP